MGRISGFISKDNIFRNVNLSSRLYGDSAALTSIATFPVLGPHGTWKEWPFSRVVTQTFTPTTVGTAFGPTWTTHWFRITFTVPSSWVGKEVHLRWSCNSEACIYSSNGEVLQGVSPGYREDYIITKNYVVQGPITYYIEMACNGMFGAGEGSDIVPPNENKFFQLSRADIVVFNRDIFKIYTDLEMLYQMANQLPNDHRGYQAMFIANEMMNLIRVDRNSEASRIADQFLAEGNGAKAHTLVAIGHCHIDTAWLWPYDETIRKCARSFTAQMGLMDEYPEYIFSCSQAQQYDWMKQYYPDVYAKIKTYVTKGQFVPVGGTWIEMDGNLPNGEAFMRQYFYGQQFFRNEFGITCKEFWLPDTFGYSAQIPQMLKHVGITRFLTQKMSWSLVNKFPNHSFYWEGIDGTEVMCHFPPGDSYNMNATVQEMLYSASNSQDKGRANVGVYLYGFGDGGGGPTRTMIERIKRMKDVDGVPKMVFGSPDYFWEELEKEEKKFYKWVGELYLELHNATYTSQARIKWYNRKCEFLFREVELLMCHSYVKAAINETQKNADMQLIDKNWKNFLLNQFHDVLPGSCIEHVAVDAWAIYREIFVEMMALRKKYHDLLLGTGTFRVLYNPLPWNVRTVIFTRPDSGPIPSGSNIQSIQLESTEFEDQVEGRYRVPNSFAAALVDLRPSGYTGFTALAPATRVSYTPNSPSTGKGTFNNGKIRLEVNTTGRPYEKLYFTGATGNQIPVYNDRLGTGIEPGMFYIYDDVPMFWDAWDVMDYHLETHRDLNYTSEGTFQLLTPQAQISIAAVYKWTATFGNGSVITRYTIMRADSPMIEYYVYVDWKEQHKFLKVEFPVDILSRTATYEIQYGHANRPTHMNTSWDMAMYEVCGHKWMDISQADKGVTFITDSKYGWHVRDNIVQLSLLRSPKNPDANCDIHKHFIYYAVLPHEGTFQQADVIRRAYELNYISANNTPYLLSNKTGAALEAHWVSVTDNPAVIIEAYKVAAAVSKTVCVRLYESFGGNASATISVGFNITRVQACNGLEDPIEVVPHTGNTFKADFKPFQIRSFLVTFP